MKIKSIACGWIMGVLAGILLAPCDASGMQRSTGGASILRSPFGVNDLFRLQGLGMFAGGPYAFSVHGGALSVTVLRPINSEPSQRWSELQADLIHSYATADVWVQVGMGKPLQNITQGARDHSGWFSPQWSPDGTHLAMLSTRGGSLRLWIWNRLTGRLRLVSRDAVAFSMDQRNTLKDQPFVWLDSRRILFTAVSKMSSPGLPSLYEYMSSRTPILATEAWGRYISGTESTASVLDDLKPPDLPRGAKLVVANIGGEEEVLADDVDTILWSVSPAGNAVAFTQVISTRLRPVDRLQTLLAARGTWRIRVIATDGRPIVRKNIHAAYNVMQRSISWSPDGEKLAYIGYRSSGDLVPSLYIFNLATDRVTVIVLKSINASPVRRHGNGGVDYQPPLWTTDGKLMVRGAKAIGDRAGSSQSGDQQQWWLVAPSGATSCLTCGMNMVPRALWPENGRRYFFGVAGGKLWRFDTISGQRADLTRRFHPLVKEMISPRPRSVTNSLYMTAIRTLEERTYDRAVFLAGVQGKAKAYVINLHSGTVTSVASQPPGAKLVWADPGGSALVYLRNDRTGLSLWRRDLNTGATEFLLGANGFLRGIIKSRLVHFPYTSLDGRKLTAWLLLPSKRKVGDRQPMITVVYPTYSYSGPEIPETIELQTAVWSDWPFNMQIAAAHGYAVLFPSIPLSSQDRYEVGIEVLNDVMPAVAEAVRRGFADPERLAVWGMSYGGEAVFDLITRTNRFRAAIASNGLSDLISAYGALDARYRYEDSAQEHVDLDDILESGEEDLGGPPWKHWLRYVVNSPIFSVERVHTPILITTGDLDYVPMQQSEEFFRALVRLNRPVRLVRYWGEEHGVKNPANIRNYWFQVFTWLRRYLPERRDNRGSAGISSANVRLN